MKNWNKKKITKQQVEELTKHYGVDPLTASIYARRGITEGKDVLYFRETDRRFLHNPFEFTNMEDVVDRILQAQEEEEKVLIFGDRDVDGVTSTTILYEGLTSLGIDVRWKLPLGNDGYGLNKAAIDEFIKDYGSLIITVDCGISNNDEIAYASSLGIDVIVLDHHNSPEVLPSPAIIIDPKVEGQGYPFCDISGAAVAFKVVSALRFSKSALYKQEICLLTVRPVNDAYTIDCLKVQNLVKKDFLSETIIPGTVSISKTRLLPFLQGQQIFVWDGATTNRLLKECFGQGVEFNFLDIRNEVATVIPSVANMSLLKLSTFSKIARYHKDQSGEIEGFFNIFVTFMEKQLASQFPAATAAQERDLQLVALAALADIMPLRDENRILIHHGIRSMENGKAREGVVELLSKQNLLGKRLSSVDLSWNIVPVLNAAGRLGKPELAVQLFIEKDPAKRDALANDILELNRQRKELGNEAWNIYLTHKDECMEGYGGKLCVVIDSKINRGVSGILASRLVQTYGVPAIVVTVVDGTAIGSMRSCRGYDVTGFLDSLGDIFINHGGHNFAAGFSLEETRLDEFRELLKQYGPTIELGEQNEQVEIDAEIPQDYLTPQLLTLVDSFEPYGEQNPELTFMSTHLRIADAMVMGKTEKQHLKLLLDCGKSKWPALFWGEAERLHRDFDKGDYIDILYQVNRNTFNGAETAQMILKDVRISE